MRLLCAFKDQKLLDQNDFIHPNNFQQFKENVSFQSGYNVEDIDIVLFDDPEIDLYMNANIHKPRKKAEITKGSLKLINIVDSTVPAQMNLDWKNCDDAQLALYFSPEDQIKIEENKDYYNNLGNEKFGAGYVFSWPHEVNSILVDVLGRSTVEILYKEIAATIL